MDFFSFASFARRAISAREEAKYHFTRLLSDCLALWCKYGEENGLSRDDLSFLTLSDLRKATAGETASRLRDIAASRRARWEEDAFIRVPPLISTPDDALGFDQSTSPNFVTREIAEGPVATGEDPKLRGSIVLLKNADPGFDWIFSRGIAGFVTAYGGENSHMAIRAREFGLPAVIGAGDFYYRRWSEARRLRLDCASRRVEVLA